MDDDAATRPSVRLNVSDSVTVQHSVKFSPTFLKRPQQESANLNMVLHDHPWVAGYDKIQNTKRLKLNMVLHEQPHT